MHKEHNRVNILGIIVDAVDMSKAIDLIENHLRDDRKGYCCALGVAGIMEARREPRLRAILNRSFLNTPDGMPLVWLARLLGFRHIRRVYGPDLMRDVCAYSADKGWKHFLYGGRPGLVDQLQQALEKRNPGIQIVGTYTPPFRDLNEQEADELIRMTEQTQPDIFWVGVSTPRQLYFMGDYLERLHAKVICPVGYAFDVNAGVKKDAPEWAKKSGLQWLHRAVTDPRLWKRYMQDNPRFVWEVLLQLCRLKSYPVEVSDRSASD